MSTLIADLRHFPTPAIDSVPMQLSSLEIWASKYQLKDSESRPIDTDINWSYRRVARALADVESDPDYWYPRFLWALQMGAVPAGRILSNAGAGEHKSAVSLINCLGGDTPVLTRQGQVPIRDLVDQDIEVINGCGTWVTVPFKSFGEQLTYKLTIGWELCAETVEVWTTADHRWFLSDGREWTTERWLKEGIYRGNNELPHLTGTLKQIKSLWYVQSIDPIPVTQEVFCCHEPQTTAFAIFNGLKTGQCVTSGTIEDSMEGILTTVKDAGLTLRAGCGDGYSFSTIRHGGAFVYGSGSYTNGPLAFMDIFDKTCATIASAGGRRGAQMGLLRDDHPDILTFIQAKQEDGRFRKFNLSVMISDALIRAVDAKIDWSLTFPIHPKQLDNVSESSIVYKEWPVVPTQYQQNPAGQVACEIVKTLPATEVWETMMYATYHFSEPGAIFIDTINRLNNNWWCEYIQSTNACVTGDTRLYTSRGLITMRELYETQESLYVAVDNRTLEQGSGVSTRSAIPVFQTAPNAEVWEVTTKAGYTIKATAWHEFYTNRGKLKLTDIRVGDELWIQSGKGWFGEGGCYELGVLLGTIVADGWFTRNSITGTYRLGIDFWDDKVVLIETLLPYMQYLVEGESTNNREYSLNVQTVLQDRHYRIVSTRLVRVLNEIGFTAETKLRVPEIIWQGSEECVVGYISALFSVDGTVNASKDGHRCSIRLSSIDRVFLVEVQQLMANFGIFTKIYKRSDAGFRPMPDGNGGNKDYYCQGAYELIVDGESRERYMEEIGLQIERKAVLYDNWTKNKCLYKRQPFVTPIISIESKGYEPVYDTTQEDQHSLIFNGVVTGNCSEQPLPPHGACLLGSLNLTKFVEHPFTPDASFNWDQFRAVTGLFTRMLDNVVEINGLPLEAQRVEIARTRRHGAGYFGLGSTKVMLGITYGSEESLKFTDAVTRELALEGWRQALILAKEKGPAPLLLEEFEITRKLLQQRPALLEDGYRLGDWVPGRILHAKYSQYMQRVAEFEPELIEELAKIGARFTHHSSIAPAGTISFSVGNNASNGVEPSYTHAYPRNLVVAGRKTRQQVEVQSLEYAAYKHFVNPLATVEELPDYFVGADQIAPEDHLKVQAKAQYWIDSAISKTINVASDYPYEDFKRLYWLAYHLGLKGCATYRYNPEVSQGVLLKTGQQAELQLTFDLANGESVTVAGDQKVFYDGEEHIAANLYEALKNDQYGKL